MNASGREGRALLFGLSALCAVLGAALVVSQSVALPAGLAFCVLAAAILNNPRFGLYLTVFALFVGTPSLRLFLDGDVLQFFPYAPLTLLTLASLFAHAAARRESLAAHSPFFIVVALIAAYQTLGVFWAPRLEFALGHAASVYINAAFFYLVLRLADTEERLERLYKILLASTLMNTAWMGVAAWTHFEGAYELLPGVELNFELFSNERWSRVGGLAAANQSAGLLVFSAMLAAGFSRLRTGWRRTAFVCLALYFFFWVVVSASRGAILAAVGGAGLFLLVHPKTRASVLRRTVVLVVVVAATVLLSKPGFIDRMLVGFGYSGPLLFTEEKGGGDTQENVSGSGARLRMWSDALKVMAEDPHKLLLGLGPGGFIHHTGEPEVHSLWLAFFFDMGLFGAVLGVFSLFILLRRSRNALARAPDAVAKTMLMAVMTGVVCEVFIHSLIDHDLTSAVSRFIWLYMACLAANLGVAERAAPETARLDAEEGLYAT